MKTYLKLLSLNLIPLVIFELLIGYCIYIEPSGNIISQLICIFVIWLVIQGVANYALIIILHLLNKKKVEEKDNEGVAQSMIKLAIDNIEKLDDKEFKKEQYQMLLNEGIEKLEYKN